jgi:Holliday junction DNA helicase RuvA
MIGYLKGTLIDLDIIGNKFIVGVNNVGYLITVSAVLLSQYKIGDEIELFIQPEIREDTFDLIGFLEKEAKVFYKKIRSVNGVGPKTALTIMNMDLNELSQAIDSEDVKKISSIPGLGKKTAERLILELKGNLPTSLDKSTPKQNFNSDVVQALENFGYKKKEVLHILESMPEGITDEQEVIKFFLNNIR